MFQMAIVVPGPRNNTLYNFKVTARQRVISHPREEHVTYYAVCEVWRGAILLSHRLFAGDLGLIMTGAAVISGNDLAAALDSYHSYIYPPLHIFIFRLLNTFNTHLPPFRFTTLYSCYWYSILLFRCECLTQSYTSNRTPDYNYLRWVWNRLIQCFGSFNNKLVRW